MTVLEDSSINNMNKTKSSRKKILPAVLWIAAGILFIMYGFVAYRAGSGTRFYLVWFFAGALCFLMEVFRRIKLWDKLPKAVKVIFLTLLAFGVCLFFAIEGFILSGFSKKGEPGLDYVIVLGAQVRKSGPSVVLKYRLDKAYEYLSENPETIAICSGGQGYNEPKPEGIAMKEYLVSRGIDEDRILAEDRSSNTIENILFSFEFLDKKSDSIGIITNDFHVFRGTAIARKQGGEHVTGIAASSNPIYLPSNMVRECIGVIKDKLLGNM